MLFPLGGTRKLLGVPAVARCRPFRVCERISLFPLWTKDLANRILSQVQKTATREKRAKQIEDSWCLETALSFSSRLLHDCECVMLQEARFGRNPRSQTWHVEGIEDGYTCLPPGDLDTRPVIAGHRSWNRSGEGSERGKDFEIPVMVARPAAR